MLNKVKRWLNGFTAYQPGTGRIIAMNNTASSGIAINEQTALSIPAFFHGVRLIAQTIGSQQFDLIQHLDDRRGQQIARTHPVHKLLHDEPNEFQSASEFRETILGHAITYGNGYAYIERNGNFRPTALLPLLPDRTRPILRNGHLVFVAIINGQEIDLQPYEVFHVKGFSFNGITGLPLVRIMADTLGLTKAEEEFAARFFGNGANMGGVVTMPGVLSDKARQNLKDSMAREYGGVANAFRTLFLEEGAKYERLGTDPEKSQLIEGRSFQLAEVARVIGIPPHLLYDLSRSTNNNIEHQGIEAVTYAFKPWANKLEQEANRKLLYESEKDQYETRLDLTPLMAGDAASQAQVDKMNFDMLALTPNERRAKLRLNPIEGGDSLYLNTAYLPLAVAVAKATADKANAEQTVTDPEDKAEIEQAEKVGIDPITEEDDTPPPNPDAGKANPDGSPGPDVPANMIQDLDRAAVIAPILADAKSRLSRRHEKAIEAAAKKYPTRAAFTAWADQWEQQERSHLAEVLQPVRQTAAALKLDITADLAAIEAAMQERLARKGTANV